MNEETILKTLFAIQEDVAEIKAAIATIPTKKSPTAAGFNPMGKNKCFAHKLRGPFLDPEIRSIVVTLRGEGKRFSDIAADIKEQWPNNPEKHPSRSSIQRFCVAARNGRLSEYGITGIIPLKPTP